MIPFLQQLAAQTGMRIQGQPTSPASAQDLGPKPGPEADIVEIEEVRQPPASPPPVQQPDIHVETEAGPVQPPPSSAPISSRQERQSRPETDDPPTPGEEHRPSPLEPQQSQTAPSQPSPDRWSEAAASPSAQDTPPMNPAPPPSAAASLHAVFKWIQEGEAQQREASDELPTQQAKPDVSETTPPPPPDPLSSRPTQDVQTAARETTGRQPDEKPASTSPAATVPAQRKAAPQKPTATSKDSTRPPTPASEPPIPSITIGSVHISVDAPPQPQPAPKRHAQPPRPAPRSAPSSNMYLRRHYIIPH